MFGFGIWSSKDMALVICPLILQTDMKAQKSEGSWPKFLSKLKPRLVMLSRGLF